MRVSVASETVFYCDVVHFLSYILVIQHCKVGYPESEGSFLGSLDDSYVGTGPISLVSSARCLDKIDGNE